ncbi:hypothetical protein Zmor_003985 [Zophobas morio]|uniref:Uncharacterized protein n=1 Tax=Zophobas morio TaxID=2755281 RepID=A0AA38HKV8_9CUCU|nr:hypothetical protein Zmor_003985 [Zophobas morio]
MYVYFEQEGESVGVVHSNAVHQGRATGRVYLTCHGIMRITLIRIIGNGKIKGLQKEFSEHKECTNFNMLKSFCKAATCRGEVTALSLEGEAHLIRVNQLKT